MTPNGGAWDLFHSLLQSGGVELAEVDPVHAVFAGQEEGLGQVLGHGDDLAVLLRLGEKLSGVFGIGGIIQIENTDDGTVPNGHVRTDGDVHL